MGMRLTKAVTVLIDGEKFPLSELMDQAERSLRVETGERVMARLSRVTSANPHDQRESSTAVIELSVERINPGDSRDIRSSMVDPRGPNA